MIAGTSLLMCLFFGCMILTFGRSALHIVAALLLAILAMTLVLPLAVLRGFSALVLVLPTGAIVAAGLLLIGGWNRKSLAALMGTVGALVLAVLLSIAVSRILQLTGLDYDFGPRAHFEVRLWYDEALGRVDFKSLLLSAIALASLGAVMDVSMTVASSLHEIVSSGNDLPIGARFRIGCRVGANVIGPMTATMLFVFFGSDLVVHVARASGHLGFWSLMRLLDYEHLAAEGVEILTAAAGLLCCIPLTALFGAILLRGERHEALDPTAAGDSP